MEYVHQNTVDRTYSLKKLQDCPAQWVRVISQERVIGSLLEKVVTTLEQHRSETTTGIQTLNQTLNSPIRDAEAALETAARQLGYDDVVEEWRRAQASLYIDPRDAITRSSSLIETVCKHVLQTKHLPTPSDQTIQSLLKTTIKALDLALEAQSSADLRQVAGGIMSVVHGLGAWRTHVGTAHGRAPDERAPTRVEARFAVNMAGAAATFLMEMVSLRDVRSRETT